MGRRHKQLHERFERDALPLLGRVLRVALHFTHDERDAEDLVQETYRRAFERFSQFREGTNLLGWLNRILYTQFVNQYRKNALRRTLSLDGRDITAPPDFDHMTNAGDFTQWLLSSAPREQLDQRVSQALDELPQPMREVMSLCVIGEMTYGEAAETLEIPIGTVMSRLSRAKLMMRQSLTRLLPAAGVASRPRPEDLS